MKDRLLLLACPLLVAMSLIACSEAEAPAEAASATEVAETVAAPAPATYNAAAPIEPEVFDNGERRLLEAPLVSGLTLPFDYSLVEQRDSAVGPIHARTSELEVFGASVAEAVDQLDANLLVEGFKMLNNKGSQGQLRRSYARGGTSVLDGAETIDVVGMSYPDNGTPKNPAAKCRLRVTVSAKG